MKALVKAKRGKGLEIQDVPEPEVGENDVLVRVERTSICGTDVHIYNWDAWAQRTIPVPMVVGHEFVGRVEAFGRNVHDVAIGETVSGEGHIVCGRCRNCLAGRRHLCPRTSGVGVNRPGAFAERLAIPVTNIWHCNPAIPKDLLACFDPLGNATHTALTFPVLGEDVLVTGAGPIGIMAAAIARHAGARYVVITDVNPYRLELARKVGVTRAVDIARESLADVQRDLGMKEGFDVGMEMSGSADALNGMIENMCHGGRIAMLGILPPGTVVDWDKVVFNSLTLKGIYGREMFETWYMMTSMIESGLDVSPVITHRFHWTEFERGFEAMRSGNSGKVVLSWED
ncbi:MAG: L-threonine 3-dehydrogenase [Kiritimatiellia bacterium]|jgi:threonine 3-dehydrogenase